MGTTGAARWRIIPSSPFAACTYEKGDVNERTNGYVNQNTGEIGERHGTNARKHYDEVGNKRVRGNLQQLLQAGPNAHGKRFVKVGVCVSNKSNGNRDKPNLIGLSFLRKLNIPIRNAPILFLTIT